jgi:hypothetical protein
MVDKKKKVTPKKVVKKTLPDELAVMQTQLSNTLTLIKELTEIVETHGKLLERIKTRMGL